MSKREVSKAAALLGRKGGQAKTHAKGAAARANGAKGGRPTAYCRNCGWLVPTEGVYLTPEYDRQSPGTPLGDRCSDTACVSERVCDAFGAVIRWW